MRDGRQRWIGIMAWAVVVVQAGTAGVSLGAGTVVDLGHLSTNYADTGWGPYISADGQVVAGTQKNAQGYFTPFRWTATTGLQPLSLFDGYDEAKVTAIDGDGSVIVGRASTAATGAGEVFKWTTSGGMAGLGGTFAFGVTADGNTVVGRTSTLGAVTWSADGTMSPVPGFNAGIALGGASADGSVIAGEQGNYPVYWTQQSGSVSLPLLPGTVWGQATAVSGDGSTIVGYDASPTYVVPPGDNATDYLAFRWTSDGGMEPLGHLAESEPGHSSVLVECVNGDGTVIGGEATGGPFVWDEAHGMRYLDNVLTSAGIDVQGWSFSIVTGISADGSRLVGSGLHNGIPSMFVTEVPTSVWVPEPGSAMLFLGAIVLVGRRRR